MIEREINGETVTFDKAPASHLEGLECLYVGQSSNGDVHLFESDDPSGAVITTTTSRLMAFANAVARGEINTVN